MGPQRVDVDLLVVGAGPTGLYATYYAGFRGLSVAVVDSLPELGGQVTALYPEKRIFDVAGFPEVKGKELVAGLAAQAASASPTYLLGRTATALAQHDDHVEVSLDDGTLVHAATMLVTAGIGTFAPRPLPAADAWEGEGVAFFVPHFTPYVDRDVVIVGGGDSAFDWALHLHPVARSVTLVHRRPRFRAHQGTIDAVNATDVRIVAPGQVTALRGDRTIEAVEITPGDGEAYDVPAQQVVAALGFVADLGAMSEWGIALEKRHVLVDTSMATNLPRVFAAGDITEYPGKVRLISVGFGEAATAVNNAAVLVHPESSLFPGHSSDGT